MNLLTPWLWMYGERSAERSGAVGMVCRGQRFWCLVFGAKQQACVLIPRCLTINHHHDRIFKPTQRLCIICLLLSSLLMPAAALGQADAIKVAGNWVQPVQVMAFEQSDAIFIAPNGQESRMSLEDLEGLTMSTRPELAKAEVALNAGEDSRAVGQFMQAMTRTSRPWLKAWIGHRLQEPLIRLGRGEQAINAYLEMAEGDVPLIWLQSGPLEAGTQLSRDQLRIVLDKIDRTAIRLAPNKRGAMMDFRQRLAAGVQGNDTPVMTLAEVAWAKNSKIPLPSNLRVDQGVRLAANGQFGAAQDWLVRELAENPGLPWAQGQKLYLLGVVRQHLAAEARDKDLYRDAALAHMRAAIHYSDTALVPFALLQAAECHLAFGHIDGAQKLYNAVMAKGGIGEATEPAFYAKQVAVQTALAAAAPATPANSARP